MVDLYGRTIRYLRLSVTDLCNLRCCYCMPAEGVAKLPHAQMLTEDEMVDAVWAAASLGVDKLRITGGEPLVKRNIVSICARTAAVPGIREVCMTTNGVMLPRYALPLADAGVSRLNISLDTLNAEKYARITRCGSLSDALRGIDTALESGRFRVKLNAVLIGGFNDDEIPALCELTRTHGIDVRFIEMMPMYSGSPFRPEAFIPCEEVLRRMPELTPAKGDGGVAALYTLPGAAGNVGLIRPVSRHFCAECNRIRITADGKIKPCLHSNAEFSIKGLDRAGMAEQLALAIRAKPRQHAELSSTHISEAGRTMNGIGG